MESARRPRFNRCKEIASLQLTTRDSEIVRNVFAHRFLRSNQIHALIGGSKQQLLRRLQLLYHHGYLDRPHAQIQYYRRGSEAIVYGVGNRGIALLEQKFGVPRRKVDWTAKNRSSTRMFLEHTLAVADIMIAFERACRDNGTVKLVEYGNDLLHWNVEVRHRDTRCKVGVVPDRVFGLKRHAMPNDTSWYFLELDRATMPIERPTLKQTSFMRKLLAYQATWQQKLLKDFPRFRILTVTTTKERVTNLLQASAKLDRGRGLFLFTDKPSFLACNEVLTLDWESGNFGKAEKLT